MSELRAILRNHMKEKLAANQVVASMTVRFARSIEIAAIAKTAGFDTLYVDLEHNTLSIDTCCQICISAQQIGITPLVRVPANTPDYICRVLDGGAMGVITPHVRSAAEAQAMVDLVKFPPLGHRSAGGALSHYQYRSFPMAETNAAMNDATSLVVMMETTAALENVEEIIATDGVDMLLIGSNDLCAEMGITGQYDHPSLKDAFARCDRGGPQGRQTRRHRRPGIARRPDDAIRADGRAIRFNRHRPVLPARRQRAKGKVRKGHKALAASQRTEPDVPSAGDDHPTCHCEERSDAAIP